MTDAQLTELERLANAATKGPWRIIGDQVFEFAGYPPNICAYVSTENGEFIAAARTAVPELIAEVRRLRGIVDSWHAAKAAEVPPKQEARP